MHPKSISAVSILPDEFSDSVFASMSARTILAEASAMVLKSMSFIFPAPITTVTPSLMNPSITNPVTSFLNASHLFLTSSPETDKFNSL